MVEGEVASPGVFNSTAVGHDHSILPISAGEPHWAGSCSTTGHQWTPLESGGSQRVAETTRSSVPNTTYLRYIAVCGVRGSSMARQLPQQDDPDCSQCHKHLMYDTTVTSRLYSRYMPTSVGYEGPRSGSKQTCLLVP